MWIRRLRNLTGLSQSFDAADVVESGLAVPGEWRYEPSLSPGFSVFWRPSWRTCNPLSCTIPPCARDTFGFRMVLPQTMLIFCFRLLEPCLSPHFPLCPRASTRAYIYRYLSIYPYFFVNLRDGSARLRHIGVVLSIITQCRVSLKRTGCPSTKAQG